METTETVTKERYAAVQALTLGYGFLIIPKFTFLLL